MTTTLERTVEDVLAEEITRTEARLEALRFAHNVLVGNPTLTIVTPEPKAAETPPPPRNWGEGHTQASQRRGEGPRRRPGARAQLMRCGGRRGRRVGSCHLPVDQGTGSIVAGRQVVGRRGRGSEAVR